MLDVHLMIERPERHVAEFVKAGADSITFHAEATPHVAYTANLIRESGACVGLAINPGTAVGALACARSSAQTSRSRSTAASSRTAHPNAARPAQTCSSQAPRSSPRPAPAM